MTGVRGKCEFCGEWVHKGEAAAFRFRAWELERGAGSATRVIGRERQEGRIAHALCVESMTRMEKLGLRGQLPL